MCDSEQYTIISSECCPMMPSQAVDCSNCPSAYSFPQETCEISCCKTSTSEHADPIIVGQVGPYGKCWLDTPCVLNPGCYTQDLQKLTK